MTEHTTSDRASRTERTILPATKLTGLYTPPPDKSIAHRALILAAIAKGRSTVSPISKAADVASTVTCLRQLGVSIERFDNDWVVDSPGADGWTAPERALDCGNSGTTMRLLTGCLASRLMDVTLMGDESLSARPMKRVAVPLRQMGARIALSPEDTAPIVINGARLRGIEYRLPVASAQVKSAILLAGLNADGETVVIETHTARDHTERMLAYAGVDCHAQAPPRPVDRREMLLQNGNIHESAEPADYHHRIVLGEKRAVQPTDWRVPGDFSAAAFLIAAAIGMKKSDLIIADVGTNHTRIGLLKVLRRMGAVIQVERGEQATGEPTGTIRVGPTRELKAVRVGEAEVPALVDELPILAVLAARAHGVTVIRGAGELRHKESDRIAAVSENLRAMGAKVAEVEDGWAIEGPTEWRAATINPHGDHRIAMAFAVAALWADGPSTILDSDVTAVSDPDFFSALAAMAHP